MHCKCGKLIEPPYEETGKCENCYADACGNFTDVYAKKPNSGTVSEVDALALPISYLELSVRVENRLSDKGILFIKDLVVKTEAELKDIPNLGGMGIAEIKRQLQIFRLSLK